MTDLLTLFKFESGEMSTQELVEMLAEMIAQEGLESLPKNLERLAKSYIAKGILDEEGLINYIKLREEND